MLQVLAVFAAFILVIYFVYFLEIIKRNPARFEIELLKVLAAWIVDRRTSARGQMWLILFLSAVIEAVYFIMVFILIENQVIIIFTVFLAGFETVHLMLIAHSLDKFFKSNIALKKIFRWRLERVSALLFFTHALLLIISILACWVYVTA